MDQIPKRIEPATHNAINEIFKNIFDRAIRKKYLKVSSALYDYYKGATTKKIDTTTSFEINIQRA